MAFDGANHPAGPRTVIERDDPTPLYHQIEEILQGRINQGDYRVGAMLPSEHEFCAEFGVSRSVVRQALNNLAQAGLLDTEPGRGRIVAGEKLSEHFVQHTTGIFDDVARQGLKVETRVVRQEIAPVPPEALEFLGVDTAVRVDRIRSADGDPFMFVSSYLPVDRCPGLDRLDLENKSLYGVLRDRFGLIVRSGHRTVEAAPIDGEIAEMLDSAEGAAAMILVGRGSDEHGRPLEWFKSWHLADRTRFEVELSPGDIEFGSGPPVATTANAAPKPVRPAVERSRGAESDAWLRELRRTRIVSVLRCSAFGRGDDIANAIVEGGVTIVEFTLTASNALGAIEQAAVGSTALVGAGSVTTREQCRRAIDAGASFIVSPISAPEIVAEAGPVPVVLAGATPTEIYNCHQLTRLPVKLFPSDVGGPALVRAISAPLPHIPLMPSGGVTAGTASNYLEAGAFALNAGSALAPPAALTTVDAELLCANAQRFVDAVDAADLN